MLEKIMTFATVNFSAIEKDFGNTLCTKNELSCPKGKQIWQMSCTTNIGSTYSRWNQLFIKWMYSHLNAVFINILTIKSMAQSITDWKVNNLGIISAEGPRTLLFTGMSQNFWILPNLLSSGLLPVHRCRWTTAHGSLCTEAWEWIKIVVFHNNCWNFSEHGCYMNGESLCVMC